MQKKEAIAIVGIGGLFPGSETLVDFWDHILNGRQLSERIGEDRWPVGIDDVYDEAIGKVDKVYSKKACVVKKEWVSLDESIIKLPTSQLSQLDELFRLLLFAGQEAYKDAKLAQCDLSRAGVVVGNLVLPTETTSKITEETLGDLLARKVLGDKYDASHAQTQRTNPINHYSAGMPAGLLAKALGVSGGSHTLDAACASSLYALKLACDQLQNGTTDIMLAGGVSRPDSLFTQMGFSQLNALSPSGVASPFDQKGDGLLVGEGAGIFVLKRLSDAAANGDHIYGVIRGIGLSNDVGGRLLAPTSEGQLRAMRMAYKEANWFPHEVDMIECHATGTPVGDAVEFESLKALWDEPVVEQGKVESWRIGQCVVGSVKSNVGHLLTAAGAAALMKMLLCLKYKTLAPTANYNNAPATLGMPESPFKVLSQSESWDRRETETTRKVALSAFGFGGINAHVLIEEFDQATLSQSDLTRHNIKNQSNAYAIVGLGAHFGQFDSIEALTKRIFRHETNDGLVKGKPFLNIDHNEMPSGHYLNAVKVSADRFRIPPKELKEMLPQQLLMLQVALDAWDDASVNQKESGQSGVYIGLGLDVNSTNFHLRWTLPKKAKVWAKQLNLDLDDQALDKWIADLKQAVHPELNANRTMGALGSIVASRIARELRIGGPSFTVSNEETSGLQALKVAMDHLSSGMIDQALVGGVDIAGDIRNQSARQTKNQYHDSNIMLSCFDSSSDTTIPGEGACAIVVKRLSDAQTNGDTIYAVINGIGQSVSSNHTLKGTSKEGYLQALENCYSQIEIDPKTIGYWETHGSGLVAEDSVEVGALNEFLTTVNRNSVTTIGSVKSDIGHTGAASGLASLVKSTLCLHHEMIPAFTNCLNADKAIQHSGALNVLSDTQYWLHDNAIGLRHSGVSSQSVDGNVFHVSLSEAPGKPLNIERFEFTVGDLREGLFLVCGNTTLDIMCQLNQLSDWVDAQDGSDKIHGLAKGWFFNHHNTDQGRTAVALIARNKDEICDQINYVKSHINTTPERTIGANDTKLPQSILRDRIFYQPQSLKADDTQEGKVAFVYPGSGNQYPLMGCELFTIWPEILKEQQLENRYLCSQYQPEVFWNQHLWKNIDAASETQKNYKAMIFGQVALGTAVTDLVARFDVNPDAVIGYSLGETAGLFSTRTWRDRDEMLTRMNASTLFTHDLAGDFNAARKSWQLPKKETADYVMGLIDRPMSVLKTAIRNRKAVYGLIANTLHECVVGGKRGVVESLVSKLGCKYIPIEGVTIAHCEVVKEVEEPYRNLHLFDTTPPEQIEFYSGAWGRTYDVTKDSAADAILAHAMVGVDYPKTIEAAYASGVRFFIEMGPGASCSRMINNILGDRPHVARSFCANEPIAESQVLRGLGQLLVSGVKLNVQPLFGDDVAVSSPSVSKHTIIMDVGLQNYEVTIPKQKAAVATNIEIPVPVAIANAPVDNEVHKKNVSLTNNDFSKTSTQMKEAPRQLVKPNSVASINAPFNNPGGVDRHPSPTINNVLPTMPNNITNDTFALLQQQELARIEAHQQYLTFATQMQELMTQNIALQIRVLSGTNTEGQPPLVGQPPSEGQSYFGSRPLFDKSQCYEFATGKLANVLGPDFAQSDSYKSRVRLPDAPLMLVDRIMSMTGVAHSLQPGKIVTEHDVLVDGWYLDNGCLPVCISVEAGQADLILSGYLGMDRESKGETVYRLLDAEITFHRHLPRPGEVIHYDIRIIEFFNHSGTWFFRFEYDGIINDTLLITMRNGCAGFFSEQALAAGEGLVTSKIDARQMKGSKGSDWIDFVEMQVEGYTALQLSHLRKGNLGDCFGTQFDQLQLNDPLVLPDGKMNLVHRVTQIIPEGGRFGLGQIIAEADIHQDDWFLTCHFVDDMVMPGTLMYECCMHTLRIYLMRMGWVANKQDGVWEPVIGSTSALKCRGQVLQSTKMVTYELTIKALGYNPAPYAIADAKMYADGKYVVDMENMSIQLTGMTQEKIASLWQNEALLPSIPQPEALPAQVAPKTAIYDHDKILAYAVGNPSEAFGAKYKIFDLDRVIARLPGPPYEFVDRVTEVVGEPWELKAGCGCQTQYQIPVDAWYFAQNRQTIMPFCILLEIVLQPCGWLAAYAGSALTSKTDLSFRNLGGKATQYKEITNTSGLLQMDVTMTNVSLSGGMIIQRYEMAVTGESGMVYAGYTEFGFFSKTALAQQLGVQGATLYIPTTTELDSARSFKYPITAPFADTMLQMIDEIEIYLPHGGSNALGFIRGNKLVDPDEWFFKAHFYQDPVNPGSLGLEAFIQLLKVVAADKFDLDGTATLCSVAIGHEHEWIYRGQVLPTNKNVVVEAVITEIDLNNKFIKADGYYVVDDIVIYQMKNFTLTAE